MDCWINPAQAAPHHHRPAALAAIAHIAHIILRDRRSGAENAQGGGNCKRDESHLSTHGGFLLLPDATRIESRADRGLVQIPISTNASDVA
jgi:hypothetical protein